MLLYWDQVSSIVPFEFIHNPESLGPYMRGLVEQELVFQVIPGAYIYEIPKFEEAFQAYLDALGPEATRRRELFKKGCTSEIHIEKMGDIAKALVEQQLARFSKKSWYEVEDETANDFMSYLAVVLGQLEQVDSSPVTDKAPYLDRFANAGVPQNDVVQQLQPLRSQVLERVLPVPSHTVEPSAIRSFKNRHADLLADFRRRVERELVAAAVIDNEALRQRRLDIFFEESDDRIEEIKAAMRGSGWATIEGSVKVLSAIPGVPPVVGLAAALWDALSDRRQPGAFQDFAYAAYARAEL